MFIEMSTPDTVPSTSVPFFRSTVTVSFDSFMRNLRVVLAVVMIGKRVGVAMRVGSAAMGVCERVLAERTTACRACASTRRHALVTTRVRRAAQPLT